MGAATGLRRPKSAVSAAARGFTESGNALDAPLQGRNNFPVSPPNLPDALKTILCMKWATAYGPKDVNVLSGMVDRNISGAFKVVCFTDDASGVRPEVTCFPLPPLGCEIPPDVPGKWPKIALWGKDLCGLDGIGLFIDLDSVIVGNIDCYSEYGDPNDVITARNWLNKLKKSGQTPVFRFPLGGHSYMLENLQADPANVCRKYQYEQNYVTHYGVSGSVPGVSQNHQPPFSSPPVLT